MPLFSRIRASTAAVVDEVAVARPSAPVLSTIGGYRPLRTLGTGACSTVFLAEDGDHCVALKVFTPECDTEAMAAEAACLSAVRSPHVVALLDTFAGLDSPTGLVLERVEGPTLDTMLRTRRRLEDGEFVTLAVSVLRGIHAVHSAGWCHGSFSSSRVRIDADGRPLLVGFSAAFTASAAGLRDERRKASELIALVSGLTDADATVSRAALVSALRGLTECVEADAPEAFEHLERELFSLAPPAPVRLSSARVPASEEIVETLRTHARPFEAPPRRRDENRLPRHKAYREALGVHRAERDGDRHRRPGSRTLPTHRARAA